MCNVKCSKRICNFSILFEYVVMVVCLARISSFSDSMYLNSKKIKFHTFFHFIGWLSVEGVELMKVFKEELDKFEAERQELANAERLFDLPITMYPELLAVQKEMKGLEMIYDLYVTQKVGSHEGTRDDL